MSSSAIIETTSQEVNINNTRVKVKTVMEVIGPPGPNLPPIAEAGPNQTVKENTLVTLNGSSSADPDPGDTLTYEWLQTGGPVVLLNSVNQPTATFTAPFIDITPPVCPPGQHLENGVCVPDVVICPPGQHLENGVCVPDIVPPTDVDENGTRMIHKTTGKKVPMEKGTDHRNGQRYNNNHKFHDYMMIGYFKTGKGQELIEMKTDGPNHGSCTKLPQCMWYEPSIEVDTGKPRFGGEWPHPSNHNGLRADFTQDIPGGFKEQWVGYCVIAYDNAQKQRVIEEWIAKDPFDTAGKPSNTWVMVLKTTETGDGKMFPADKVPRTLPVDFDQGLESEIRMHKATNHDTEMKWCNVWELQTPVASTPTPTATVPPAAVTQPNPAVNPLPNPEVILTFQLKVTDIQGANSTDLTNVTVTKEIPLCPPGQHLENGVCVPDIIPQPGELNRFIVFADNDVTSDAKDVLKAITTAIPDVNSYLFAGDGPYASSGTKWVTMMKESFNTPEKVDKLILSQGNHEDEESESEQTQKDIEAWIPSLKDTPEVAPNQPNWEKTSWLTSKQIGNVYLISMNSQDMDVEFKERNQYNWVQKQINVAKQLRTEGKIDWIFAMVHKPWFTLKSSHSPYTAVRNLYKDMFREAQVDFVLHGHNHNTQLWLPIIATMDSGNASSQQLFTKKPDGTFDFSKDHGQAYIVSGHGGHEHNAIKETNANVMYSNDKEYGFTQIDVKGKEVTVQAKDVSGAVKFEYKVTRAP